MLSKSKVRGDPHDQGPTCLHQQPVEAVQRLPAAQYSQPSSPFLTSLEARLFRPAGMMTICGTAVCLMQQQRDWEERACRREGVNARRYDDD